MAKPDEQPFIERMLDWIDAYEREATMGPWSGGWNEIRAPKDAKDDYGLEKVIALEYGYYDSCDLVMSEEDSRFIMESRTDLPHLSAALRVAVKALREGGNPHAALGEIEKILKRPKQPTPA